MKKLYLETFALIVNRVKKSKISPLSVSKLANNGVLERVFCIDLWNFSSFFHRPRLLQRSYLLLCIMFSASLFAEEDMHSYDGVDYRWYWNTNLGIVVPDDDIRLNEAQVIDLRVGKHFNENWAMEFEVMRDEYDFDIDFDLKHYSATFNVMYTNHDPLWKPYFLIGVGGIYSDSRFPDVQESDLIVNLAIGGSWYFTGHGVRIRAEARSRLDTNDSDLPGQDGFGDGQFTIGIIVPIGD